ncbi:hypothetical protein SCA6_011508 [Theobroma cacao]
MVTNGEWDEVEKYLSGFTKVDDNRYSMKIFFEIRKQKYLEALDKRDRAKAVDILVKDLKVFSAFNEELFKEITHLLTLDNFRENEQLSKYGDTKSARSIMLAELKKLIEANPLFRDKLQFPTLKNSRLRTLINQSLNWQHQLCKNPRPNPDIKTLFVDHSCGQPNGARAPSPVTNPLMSAVPKAGGFPPLGAHGPFQPTPAALPTSLAGWMANPTPVPHPAASAGPIGLTAPNNAAAILKRPRTPPTNNPAMDYQSADSEHVLKRSRPFGMPDEVPNQLILHQVNNLPVNILPVPYAGQSHVGTNTGDIMVWEVGSGERIAHKTFKVWDAVSGAKQHIFEGHEAPVYSICPHHKENIQAPNMGAFGSNNATIGTTIGDRAAPVAAMVGMSLQSSDGRSLADVKPRIADESVEKSRIWKLTEINEPTQCRSLRLSDNLTAMRVSRLIYTNSGLAILALSSNAVHKLWKWQRNDRNLTGKATTSVAPQLWQPSSGILMTNDITDTNPEDAVPCFALSKNDSYVMSASGGKISLFNMMTFKTMTTFMPPPPAATFLAFHPQDNNIIAIGMDDSSIQIYNVRVDEVKTKLKGHQKRITGLAFSHTLNVLVSSGADSQLCVWSTDGWEKQASKYLQIPNGRAASPHADTRVQFHLDQIHLLAVHETQIAIYEAPNLECLKQFVPREASGPITHATYSCDSQSIYVSFEDGSVGVLTASTLRLRCRIGPAAYLPPNPSLRVYPLVIAAHPSDPNQFALGLTDGGVHILEPLESEGKWGTSPPVENGAGPSNASGANGSEPPQR